MPPIKSIKKSKYNYYKHWGGEEEEEEEEPSDNEEVAVHNNNIYFYGAVNTKNILSLNMKLKELADEIMIKSIKAKTKPSPIFLHIQSDGGDAFCGLSCMDNITCCQVPVYTIMDGMVASAATFLAMAGHRRLMYENSFVLIHQIRTCFWGTYECLKDEMKNNDLMMKIVKKQYLKRSKMPEAKLDDILKRELWLNAEECLEYGIVDNIIKPSQPLDSIENYY